jgi:hypothetical protein
VWLTLGRSWRGRLVRRPDPIGGDAAAHRRFFDASTSSAVERVRSLVISHIVGVVVRLDLWFS